MSDVTAYHFCGDQFVSKADYDRLIAAKEQSEKERDEALPWKLFYGDGKTLGEVAAHFGKTIYDFSPWLAAPIVRAVRNATMEESARIETLTARLRSMCEAMEKINEMDKSDIYFDGMKAASIARAALASAKKEIGG